MKQETNTNQENTKDTNSKHVANISIIYFVAFLILLISFVCFGQENASHNSQLPLPELILKDGSETMTLFIVDISKAQANYKKEALRYTLRQSNYYQSQKVHLSDIAKFNMTNSITAIKNSETDFLRFNPKTGVQLTLLKIIF